MSVFKPQQRHLVIQGRTFHFVSYEGHAANPKKGEESAPPMWYLMVEGRRCPVFPCDESRSDEQLEEALTAWATRNAFGPPEAKPAGRGRKRARRDRSHENWWGPH